MPELKFKSQKHRPVFLPTSSLDITFLTALIFLGWLVFRGISSLF